MPPCVEVIAPGALATVQDLGRPGWRRLGVPRGGALNPGWLRIANALAGNDEAAPAIEFFAGGTTLLAHGAPLQLAFAGDFTIERGGDGGRATLAGWRSLTLQPGDRVRVGAPRDGRVGYIALRGLRLPAVLGSASTYARAGLGGLAGGALRAGDRLAAEAVAPDAAERGLATPPTGGAAPIRAVPGPQDDHFDADTLAAFFATDYRVSTDADRMGLRLDGPALQHRADKGSEVISDAALPGSVQVPGKGQPIVLLADGGTVGGYPKIATVISADLPRLATASTGSMLRFAAVSVAEAEAAARDAEEALRRCIAGIGVRPPDGGFDLGALYAGNLVSGIIDARQPPD